MKEQKQGQNNPHTEMLTVHKSNFKKLQKQQNEKLKCHITKSPFYYPFMCIANYSLHKSVKSLNIIEGIK